MELQQLILVIDTARNLEGLRRDMIANAEDYKTLVAREEDTTRIRELILANNEQYKKRLKWIKDLYDNHQAIFTSSLEAMGITITHTLSIYQELKAITEATDTADLGNGTKITTAADWVLNNLASHLTVW